jgi:Aspartyl protease/PDZ domain
MNLIIIKATINGKEHDFIYDTGALNVITTELAKELNLSVLVKQNVMDSQNTESKLGFTTIPKITIADVNFLNTCAAIADFSKVPELAALKVDGIIGANLMRLATWQIDFQTQKMKMVSSLDSLPVDLYVNSIDFTPALTGTPFIDLKFGNKKENMYVFDTGSNGDIISNTSSFQKLKKSNVIKQYVAGFGNLHLGLTGKGKPDTTYFGVVNDIAIGDVKIKQAKVDFNTSKIKTVGLGFTANYNVILDWKKKKIRMHEQKPYNNLPFKSIGFIPALSDGNIVVSFLFQNGDAQKNGMQVGDKILSVNGQKLTTDILTFFNLIHADNFFKEGVNQIVFQHENEPPKSIDVLFQPILK